MCGDDRDLLLEAVAQDIYKYFNVLFYDNWMLAFQQMSNKDNFNL